VCHNLRFNFLTEYGKGELEFILMYMYTHHGLKRVSLLGHIGALLLVYLRPSEVYSLFMKLLDNTGKIKNNPAEKNNLRWHLPKDEQDQGQIISAFLDTFMRNTNPKESKVLIQHFFEKQISFDMILHKLFNSLCQCVMTLEQSFHILMNFMFEGQKLLFRTIFALIKLNYWFLYKTDKQEDLLEKFQR
jgi:hypothetical protein